MRRQPGRWAVGDVRGVPHSAGAWTAGGVASIAAASLRARVWAKSLKSTIPP